VGQIIAGDEMRTDLIITDFISELNGRPQSTPKPDTSLIDSGILDSTAVLRLLVFIEERFNLTIDDQDVTPQNFETIRRITAFIESKRKAAPDGDEG
jgi:acyl carrier protein